MAIRLLIGRRSAAQVEDLEFDATVSENHAYVNTISKNPVEDGFDISDHVKQEPIVLQMVVFITDYPVVYPGDRLQSLLEEDGKNRTNIGFLKLLEYGGFGIPTDSGVVRKAKKPIVVDVITSQRIYPNMLMTLAQFPVVNSSMDISLTFEEFRVVQSQTTIVPKVKATSDATDKIDEQAQPNNNTGTEVPQDVDDGSILYKTGKAISDKFKGWKYGGD